MYAITDNRVGYEPVVIVQGSVG